ncbi:hypothetical protein [uncultured Helicobacter sp.]|uniref:hypothetical protein n=1 Tax=uncultured Helicobacter sp. TaxID=175537 RepID=UPI00374F6454
MFGVSASGTRFGNGADSINQAGFYYFMQVLLWQNLVSLAESESLLTPLRDHT